MSTLLEAGNVQQAVQQLAAKDLEGEIDVRKVPINCGPVEVYDALEKGTLDDPGKQYIAVGGKLFRTKDEGVWPAVNGALRDKPCAADQYALLFLIIERKLGVETLARDPDPTWDEPGKRLHFRTMHNRTHVLTDVRVAIAPDGNVSATVG